MQSQLLKHALWHVLVCTLMLYILFNKRPIARTWNIYKVKNKELVFLSV